MSSIGKRRLRRPFAWLLIVQQLVAGAGISLPCPAAAASKERYPCEHCGCGCRSAEQCWTHCSCFTFDEKVAWARRNGIAVPAYAEAAAKRMAAGPRKPTCPHAHRHCQSQAEATSHDDRASNHDEQPSDKDRSSRGICWLNALRCRGVAQQFQAITVSWPGDRHVESCVVLPPRGRVDSQPLIKHIFSPSPPPTPPPNEA
jgi:hypothetical protein